MMGLVVMLAAINVTLDVRVGHKMASFRNFIKLSVTGYTKIILSF